jgi:hypothetical protein
LLLSIWTDQIIAKVCCFGSGQIKHHNGVRWRAVFSPWEGHVGRVCLQQEPASQDSFESLGWLLVRHPNWDAEINIPAMPSLHLLYATRKKVKLDRVLFP